MVNAVFDIGEESVRVTTGGDVLGSWALSDVAVEDRGDALLVTLGGESVLVDIGDRDGFSAAMSPQKSRKRKRRRRRPMTESGPPDKPASAPDNVEPRTSRVEPQPPAFEKPTPRQRRRRVAFGDVFESIGAIFDPDNWSDWLADRTIQWTIAAMSVVVFAMLALFATNALGMILILVGMIALILGAFAVSEDFSAHQMMPDWLSETGLVVVGAVATALGVILMIVG